MRDYIPGKISTDGRNIEYKLVTANDYLRTKEGLTEEEIDNFLDNKYELYNKINQIMAIKQSCYLLRRVSHSCGSLSDSLYELKLELIMDIKDKYGFSFDDEFVENYGFR